MCDGGVGVCVRCLRIGETERLREILVQIGSFSQKETPLRQGRGWRGYLSTRETHEIF